MTEIQLEPTRHVRYLQKMLIFALAPIPFLIVFFTPFSDGQIFFFGDMLSFHLPTRLIYSESIQQFEFPLWIKHFYTGYPLVSEGQIGAFHPLHIVLYYFIEPWKAIFFETLASFYFAYVGAVVFLRSKHVQLQVNLFISLCFGFSFFMVSHFQHLNMIFVIAHLPWILWVINLFFNDKYTNFFFPYLLLAFLIVSQIFLGHPIAFVYSAMVWAPYMIIRALFVHRKVIFFRCLGAIFLGLLMGSVQIFLTNELLSEAVRPAYSASFVNHFSLHYLNFLQILNFHAFEQISVSDPYLPPAPHEFVLSINIGLLLVTFWFIAKVKTNQQKQKYLLGVFLIFFTLLMLGRYGGINFFASYLPLLKNIRVPARYSFIVYTIILATVTWAFSFKYSVRDSRSLRYLSIFCILLVFLYLLYQLMFGNKQQFNLLVIGSIISIIPCLVFIPTKNLSLQTKFFFMVSVLLGTLYTNYSLMKRLSLVESTDQIASLKVPSEKDTHLFRIWDTINIGPDVNKLNVIGYFPLMYEYYKEDDFKTLSFLGVNKVYGLDGNYELPEAMPRFRAIGVDDQKFYFPNKNGFIVQRDLNMEQIIIAKFDQPVILEVADRYDSNWLCQVNGKNVPIQTDKEARVRRIAIGAGANDIKFYYKSSIYEKWRLVSLITFIFTLICLVFSLLKYKNRINYKS